MAQGRDSQAEVDAPPAADPSEAESPPSSEDVRLEPPADSWPAPSVRLPEEQTFTWRAVGMLRTMRPHQWIKNVFVLAPVVFARSIFDVMMLVRAGLAFLVFCLLAGAVYTFNDLADVESDRRHPIKRIRPIASGRVPENVARTFAKALVLVSLVAAFFISPWLALVAASYFALNVAYSIRLKHVAYVDVACIAAGFVLRVLGGGVATRIAVSWYLFVCTALLALFLGLGKRRHELTTAQARASEQRLALESYTKKGLDRALATTAISTTLVYLIYTLDPHTRAFFRNDALWPTTGLVLLGVMRFIHIVKNRPKAESPTQEMLSDGPMVAIVLIWIGVVMWLVYNLHPS